MTNAAPEVSQRRKELETAHCALCEVQDKLATAAAALGASHALAMALYALIVAVQRGIKKLVKELKTLS